MNLHIDIQITLSQSFQDNGHDKRRGRKKASNLNGPLWILPDLSRFCLKLLSAFQQPFCPGRKLTANRRKRQPVRPFPNEKIEFEIRFDLLNGCADCGLGNAQALGCRRDASMVCDSHKVGKLA